MKIWVILAFHVHMCPSYGTSSSITIESPNAKFLSMPHPKWESLNWNLKKLRIFSGHDPNLLQKHFKYEIMSSEIVVLMPIFLPIIMPLCSKTCLHEHVGNHYTNLETTWAIFWEGTTTTHSSCHCSQIVKSRSITRWTSVGNWKYLWTSFKVLPPKNKPSLSSYIALWIFVKICLA